MTKQDIDIQKIQILESSYHGWFNFKASIIAGSFVGFTVLAATIKFQNLVDFNSFLILNLAIWLFVFYTVIDMQRKHNQHISFINTQVTRIENGEKLESIEELRDKHPSKAVKATKDKLNKVKT